MLYHTVYTEKTAKYLEHDKHQQGKRTCQPWKNDPAGWKAFEKRDEKRSGIYSYERAASQLSPDFIKKFRANKEAWKYFQATAPWYQRTATHWVTSAKKEEDKIEPAGKVD
jgi:hypothetical protein